MEKILLKNSIRLLVGGYLFDGGEIYDVPNILEEIWNDYKDTIKKEIKNARRTENK